MSDSPDWLRPLLAKVFEAKWGEEDLPDFAGFQGKFVFHMADAAEEIRRLAELLSTVDGPGPDDLAKVLRRFFLHAVPHLVAAGQIYDYVPDLFPEQKGVHVLADDGQRVGGAA